MLLIVQTHPLPFFFLRNKSVGLKKTLNNITNIAFGKILEMQKNTSYHHTHTNHKGMVAVRKKSENGMQRRIGVHFEKI